jgi:hypothetical protein
MDELSDQFIANVVSQDDYERDMMQQVRVISL